MNETDSIKEEVENTTNEEQNINENVEIKEEKPQVPQVKTRRKKPQIKEE